MPTTGFTPLHLGSCLKQAVPTRVTGQGGGFDELAYERVDRGRPERTLSLVEIAEAPHCP